MGIFGKLFEKKICDICGGEIGLLGNRKLEDGNCCKSCAGKLSPWFDDRRHSTVAQINEQLAYRAENERKLASFRVDQVIGDYYKMYIEEENGVPTRFFVTSHEPYAEANPDILLFKDLQSCTIDVDTDETELKQEDANGNKVSYNPPRYETTYNFYVKMYIGNNPYFDDIRFKLNASTVTLETRGGSSGSFLGINFTAAPVDVSSRREQERYQKYTAMCQQIEYMVQRSRGQAVPPQTAASPVQTVAPVQTATPVAPAAKGWTCAACGNENTGKFCADCGAPMPSGWSCFCGAVNTGKFCQNCGTMRFTPDEIECSECSWTVEEDGCVPAVCPNCGKPFTADDIR